VDDDDDDDEYAECLYGAWLKSVTGSVPLAAAAAIFSVSHRGRTIS